MIKDVAVAIGASEACASGSRKGWEADADAWPSGFQSHARNSLLLLGLLKQMVQSPAPSRVHRIPATTDSEPAYGLD